MKRDMTIIWALLEAAEALNGGSKLIALPNVDEPTFWYHAQLAADAGLVGAKITPAGGTRVATSAVIFRLTWSGHQLLDQLRESA